MTGGNYIMYNQENELILLCSKVCIAPGYFSNWQEWNSISEDNCQWRNPHAALSHSCS